MNPNRVLGKGLSALIPGAERSSRIGVKEVKLVLLNLGRPLGCTTYSQQQESSACQGFQEFVQNRHVHIIRYRAEISTSFCAN